jgi:hypothetical protein
MVATKPGLTFRTCNNKCGSTGLAVLAGIAVLDCFGRRVPLWTDCCSVMAQLYCWVAGPSAYLYDRLHHRIRSEGMASRTGRRPTQNLPHLHMPPAATVSCSDLPRVELSSDAVETCVTGRLDVPNDRQDVGRKLGRLRLTGHAHPLHGAGWAPPGVPRRVPRALVAVRAALVRSTSQ